MAVMLHMIVGMRTILLISLPLSVCLPHSHSFILYVNLYVSHNTMKANRAHSGVKRMQVVLCALLCVLEYGQSLRAVGGLLKGGGMEGPSRPFDWTDLPLSGLELRSARLRGEECSLTD